ncbi:cytochrome b5 isoform X2 [Halyomorpha halys]|uniref:cytochrome b5 isoform X2 n=1 Tax=Halyomorpha halys TaxID=286706 RepID=UPI0006D4D833|nr:cytochrome b5 isoform X2 [Halyomorpha halys]
MTTETAIYSLEEVRNKCDGKNIWFVIHNSVYDVTNYLEEHPGGEELLLEQTGLDATEAFETFDHSDATTEAMKKYKIGELAEEDRVTFVKINRWDEYQEASRKRARYRYNAYKELILATVAS